MQRKQPGRRQNLGRCLRRLQSQLVEFNLRAGRREEEGEEGTEPGESSEKASDQHGTLAGEEILPLSCCFGGTQESIKVICVNNGRQLKTGGTW